MNAILSADITNNAVVYSAAAIGAGFFLLLFLRPGKRWTLRALLGIGIGVVTGLVLIWLLLDELNVFQVPIKTVSRYWFVAACAGVGLAIASFWRSRRWRKWVAAISILVFMVVGGLGINAQAGINKTLGSVFGIYGGDAVALPDHHATTGDETVPLYQRWKPPADMPSSGSQGSEDIPNTKSGFNARPAGIYLPPAARVANPPRLPLVVMLMGQPGGPDPQFIGAVLDKFAADNNGLAPIVVVADQIGPDQNDTLCVDSAKYGKVETYIMDDVVSFAKAKLNVLPDPRFWTIAGYSNGGQCAISLGAKHPDVFGNILDISGEEFPGAEDPASALADVFQGNQEAYDAQKPLNLMAGKHYTDSTAIFTAGSDDPVYVASAQKVSAAAKDAGMNVTYYEVPNGGHLVPALNGGLEKGFEILYPRLGLSK